jgi:hypothetical protein
MEIANSGYPATLAIESPEKITNWRPLVQWFLAIPHFLVLRAFNGVAGILAIISWVAIVFTGKLPPGIAEMQSLYLRYSNRVTGFAGFLVVDYPPFAYSATNADGGDYPGVRVDVAPELEDRNRLTTFFRLILVIPHVVVLAILGIVALVAWIISAFVVLFTGQWNEGMRTFVVGYMRWSLRVSAYALLLNDVYPPFSLD